VHQAARLAGDPVLELVGVKRRWGGEDRRHRNTDARFEVTQALDIMMPVATCT